MAVDRREILRLVPSLRRYARGLEGGVFTADDLVQETIAAALTNEGQFRGGNLRGWLFAILTNTARSRARSSSRLPPIGQLVDTPDVGADPVARIGILAALSALTANHREVLLLTSVEGLSYRETAELLDVPVGTVMSRLARAKDDLSARLEGAPIVPIRRKP